MTVWPEGHVTERFGTLINLLVSLRGTHRQAKCLLLASTGVVVSVSPNEHMRVNLKSNILQLPKFCLFSILAKTNPSVTLRWVDCCSRPVKLEKPNVQVALCFPSYTHQIHMSYITL